MIRCPHKGCKKSFKTIGGVKSHWTQIHRGEDISKYIQVCEIDGKQYMSKSALKRHKKKVHPVEVWEDSGMKEDVSEISLFDENDYKEDEKIEDEDFGPYELGFSEMDNMEAEQLRNKIVLMEEKIKSMIEQKSRDDGLIETLSSKYKCVFDDNKKLSSALGYYTDRDEVLTLDQLKKLSERSESPVGEKIMILFVQIADEMGKIFDFDWKAIPDSIKFEVIYYSLFEKFDLAKRIFEEIQKKIDLEVLE